MSAVADALEGATEEIFIADWWLSPEIYMKRPAIDGDYWRLDQILKRKAQQGIKVFLLLFKEVELALGISSYYSKQKLVELHENIKVLRHPDHALSGIILWAHHEKIVVVDQTYGYLGGIDLCYGRWDDHNHRLTDLGSISSASAMESGRKESTIVENPMNPMWQLMHQSKDILAATAQTQALTSLPPIKERAEDISEHTKRNTPEMERKNYLGKLKTRGKDFIHRIAGDSDSPDETPERPDSPEAPDVPDSPEQPSHVELNGLAKWWCGKDYTNFILKDFVELNLPFTDQIDRTCTPRMPWHDIGCVVVGHSARDLARHFIQRWNAAKLEKARENLSFPYLLPKSYTGNN